MATFKKHKMASSQPHSYGLFIGGADLQSDTETMMYCIVNGTVVKTLPRSAFIAADRLRSTDGVYGIRASHNVEITVSNFMKH